MKMNFGYWRDLEVDVVSKEDAADVFEKKDATPVRYKKLQDYLLRYIIAKTADYGLPTQIHIGGAVPQSMMVSDPVRFDSFLMLPDVAKAKVVLLHGAIPMPGRRLDGQQAVHSQSLYGHLSVLAVPLRQSESPRRRAA
jgi:predicted TIM-barrel fold metal-dependent hydrolase